MPIFHFRQALSPNWQDHGKLGHELDTIIVHRIAGNCASDVTNMFLGGVPEAAKATGYKMPYHFIVEPDGDIVQCLPLSVQGPHAWKWNKRSIGVGCLGDFRWRSPQRYQWLSAVMLAALLAEPQGWQVIGHDEAPEGSTDPNKQCPGPGWPMVNFREGIEQSSITFADVDDFWRYVAC